MDPISPGNRQDLPGPDPAHELTIEEQLAELREENRLLSNLCEEAIAKSNSLTMKAEIARLEFEQVFNSVADATWVLNDQYSILRINKAFLNLLGLKNKEEAVSKKCYELLPSGSCRTVRCPMIQIRNGRSRIELDVERNINTDKAVPFLVTAMPLFGLSNEIIGLVEQFKDITERKRFEEAMEKANKELEQLAAVDGLTQLANRRVFDQRYEGEWLRMKREKGDLSLILCDIDFFKRYNDYYGHLMGDECLKAVAACIKQCVRRPADLAARYGGEEFCILLPATPFEGAFLLAEMIRRAVCLLKREHARSAVSDSVTLSLGVASVNPSANGNNPAKLLKAADLALYAAKEGGRNLVRGAAGAGPKSARP
jgi:diguanylate cyclase (GGDEF)-like protein/PAS domain S-box-containing protein